MNADTGEREVTNPLEIMLNMQGMRFVDEGDFRKYTCALEQLGGCTFDNKMLDHLKQQVGTGVWPMSSMYGEQFT